MRSNLITAIVLMVFSVVFWLGADAIPKSSLGGSVGADGLPKLLAIALGILSTGLLVQTLLMMRTAGPVVSADQAEKTGGGNRHLRAIGMILIGAAYLVLVPYLGYMLTVGLLLLAVALYNGKRPSLGLLVFAVLGSIGFYLLFVRLLDVPLPAGLWPSLVS